MLLSTAQSAAQLGVSDRQVRRAAASGQLEAGHHGHAYTLAAKQVRALGRTGTRGRPWSPETRTAALDLLSGRSPQSLRGARLRRLADRVRTAAPRDLAGHLLRGSAALRRAPDANARARHAPKAAHALGLTPTGGLAVVVSEDAAVLARKLRMPFEPEGDVVLVSGAEQHTTVLEVCALFAFGDTREHAAAGSWLLERARSL